MSQVMSLHIQNFQGVLLAEKQLPMQLQMQKMQKKEWLLTAIEENIEIAEPESADSYSGQFKLRLQKTLHKTLAEDSTKEGVSMYQYCVYLLAKNSEKEHVALAKKQAVLV